MRAILKVLARRSVQGLLVLATACAILGCCCPAVPLPLTRVVAQPDEVAPVQLIAGPAAVR